MVDHRSSLDNPQFTFRQTIFTAKGSAFWHNRREIARKNTLPYQLDTLKSTGRYDAFKLLWRDSYNEKPDVWPVPNHLFWDSDLAKWMEGACYFLEKGGNENLQLRQAITDLTEMICSAQQTDGYLNIHFTVVAPNERFTNLRDMHELYNAGHLIEAAIAHYDLTSNTDLLDTICRYTGLLCKRFGPGPEQIHGYPGHPEVELALLRLYRATSRSEYFELATYFIQERGNPTGCNGRHFYDVEAEARGERPHERPVYYPSPRSYWYQQAHKPIAEQDSIEGHAVRAMYLLAAVADLIHLSPSLTPSVGELKGALYRLWDNMVSKKMYLTGGIGAHAQWEGFGIDYFLPQSRDEGGCYAETCAAIGLVMLAERMLRIELDSRIADVAELCLYNAILTGVSLDGTRFTYDNPLASSPDHPSRREDWFRCACCLPNVTCLLGSLGGYFSSYTSSAERVEINIHQYTSATLHIPLTETAGAVESQLQLEQTSGLPWKDLTEFSLHNAEGVDVTIRLRIPSWAHSTIHSDASWSISPEPAEPLEVHKGYLVLGPSYTAAHRSFSLRLPLRPRLVSPHPYTNQHIVALARGPLIYCVEDVDNPWVSDHFKDVVVRPDFVLRDASAVTETYINGHDHKTNGINGNSSKTGVEDDYVQLTLRHAAFHRSQWQGAKPTHGEEPAITPSGPTTTLDTTDACRAAIPELHFVPYFFRANRGGRGQMRVGLRVS